MKTQRVWSPSFANDWPGASEDDALAVTSAVQIVVPIISRLNRLRQTTIPTLVPHVVLILAAWRPMPLLSCAGAPAGIGSSRPTAVL